MLNATWLQTFTTLCEVDHFTRTAEILGMTQPGVSQHLRKLEAQIGAALIVKDGKSFTLTPAGEAVRDLGLLRRKQERDLFETVQADDPDRGEVSIGCSRSFAMWLYPHLIERMRHAPDLVVRVSASPRASIVSAVVEGALDLGIVAETVAHPRLQVAPLAREELCLVLPAGYEREKISLALLNDLGFVAHPDGFQYADDLLWPNFPDDYTGADRLRLRSFVNQIGQIPLPVAQGLGFTILPRAGVDAFAGKPALSVVSLPRRRFHDLFLIARRGRANIARIEAIKALIREVAARLT